MGERRERGAPQAPANTGELVRQPQENPFLAKLRSRGLETAVPDRFLNPDNFPEGTHLDPRTGVPVENDDMRTFLASKLTQSIKEGKGWACIYADADNLKGANNFGRLFGNALIVHGMAAVCTAIDEVGLEDASIFATRQDQAADEAVIWLFDVSDEQIERVTERVVQLNRTRKKLDDPPFTFSTSAAMISSKDPEIQDEQTRTRDWLRDPQNSNAKAFDMYNHIKDRGDDETKIIKISKDLARLPLEEASKAKNVEEVIELFVKDLGGTRVSGKLLATCFAIVRNQTVLDLLKNPPSQEDLRRRFNLSNVQGAVTPEELRVLYFRQLFAENNPLDK